MWSFKSCFAAVVHVRSWAGDTLWEFCSSVCSYALSSTLSSHCPADVFYILGETDVTSEVILPAFTAWDWPFLPSIPSKSGKVNKPNIYICAAHTVLKLWHEQLFSLVSVWTAAVNWAGKVHQLPPGWHPQVQNHLIPFRTARSL